MSKLVERTSQELVLVLVMAVKEVSRQMTRDRHIYS